ncbi:MAG: response regulator [Luteolibacter sp.]
MPIHALPSPSSKNKGPGNLPLYVGFAAAVIFFISSGIIAFRNTVALREGAQQVERTHAIIATLENLSSLVKDAETGQRGFLITGDEKYLQPYHAARTGIEAEIVKLRELTSSSTTQRDLLFQVEAQIAAKIAELEETIGLRRSQGFDAARAIVLTDRGKQTMDGLRNNLGTMEREESRVRDERMAEMDVAHRVAVASGIVTAVLGLVLSSAVTWLIRRAHILRRQQEWSQTGRLELTAVMSGEKGLEPLSNSILSFLTRYVDAHVGAIFATRKGHFERVGLIGAPLDSGIPERFERGEGLLGRAVAENRLQRIEDVPEGYLTVGSGLGKGRPRHLLILPAAAENQVNAVIELGFLHPLDDRKQAFLQQISEMVAVAVKSAVYRENLQELLVETQQQAEELQAHGEELRVANEQLEEQSRALRESQSRLEQQQAEMEQTNSQLEEQTRLLEDQKDQLVRGQETLETQARAVEQASRYKSDFLANMSHELRTPLNSSLILAKLLGDNRGGNLSDEQVKYARTIESAGNDLLALINDVLDLSKIEAGHMSVTRAPVKMQALVGDLEATFAPIAEQRSLALSMQVDPEVPQVFHTDAQRLRQILKNLLSNALKFTNDGGVSMTVRRAEDGRIAFAVRDTGIGIAPEQQRMIFEPFQQADGTIDRKYGGTGLGLSISRELARLLGGEITLVSEQGVGSTFTVTVNGLENSSPMIAAGITQSMPPRSPSRTIPSLSPIVDDRENLAAGSRVILVVEDDDKFAGIMAELAHEMGFQCLIATTGEEALELARRHQPGAIVLDVILPGDSGLLVLEQLKGDARTRHIPVHMVSGSDYIQTALSLGAVGYMLKPVKREQLVHAFRDLENRLTQKLRRVLVVEDDPVQAEAMQHLLGTREVEITAVNTAAECLEKLKTSTFDCMVLDLSLPDASGFTLLETLSSEDIYSFPPVIVYTGRDLSAEQEQRLRGYSKSIIIKGAKSHERLLDEVSLFLHQVVSELPPEQRRILEKSPNRDAALEGRHILVAEDDVRNIFALTGLLENRGVKLQIARNGLEAIAALEKNEPPIELVLMDVMMPEMDGLTAMREIRKRDAWKKLPIIALTAKAMKSDQEQCFAAGASDYLSKPLDVEKLLSLIRVWMPR